MKGELKYPIVIYPAGTDPIQSDREHVIVLSDHSQMTPEAIFRKMKQTPGYFNYQQQTFAGLLKGEDQPLAERLKWGRMRMDPTDVSDATGPAYTYLVNGHGPLDNWTALFRPGERVRLRVINASSMTTFNVRIPGLKLTVVQADGCNVRPIDVDEFQIGIAETYDVIVNPAEDRAYTLIGETVDRAGMARATLAPRAGMVGAVPPLRKYGRLVCPTRAFVSYSVAVLIQQGELVVHPVPDASKPSMSAAITRDNPS